MEWYVQLYTNKRRNRIDTVYEKLYLSEFLMVDVAAIYVVTWCNEEWSIKS